MKKSYMYGVALGMIIVNCGSVICMKPKGQVVKFEVSKNGGSRDRGLPCDVVVHEVAPRVDIPTQRNISAVCRAARSKIKIQELEDAEIALNGRLCLRLYPFWSENDLFDSVLERHHDYIKRLFKLADATKSDPALAKTVFLEGCVPSSQFGLWYQYMQGLVKKAIRCGDKDFAVDLIKANPRGFAGGSDVKSFNRFNWGVFPHGEVCDLIGFYFREDNPQFYIELCKQQPSRSYALAADKDHCTIL